MARVERARGAPTVAESESVEALAGREVVAVPRVFVSQLRKKLEPDPSQPTLIVTEPGVGYRWEALADEG